MGALALTIPASAAFAAEREDPAERFPTTQAGAVGSSFTPRSVSADGEVTVILQMSGDPVAVVQAEKGRKLTASEKKTVKGKLKKTQDAIADDIASAGGDIQAQMQSAYNGIQVSLPLDEVDAVASLPGVVAVHEARTYELENAVSVPFLGVPEVWESTGYTGAGVKVAIIDTGIDYTHADFGGEGTVAAYEAAHAQETSPADPDWFGDGAPRVKGGIDLVGDAYDAGVDGSVPMPDPNPLDCQGHGSHVAGTAAGGGVLADGSVYAGPYDSSTAETEFLVAPGVAPEADLYAVRVFGCEGSTNMVVPAIDWAVDNGMDVINMSLGSPYGRADEPDAIASANAVAAGVVVIAAAGNDGHSAYMTGSPGTGSGVVSVAAVDSTATFPGAEITVDGTAVPAINANGADLGGLGELDVVRLVDDPATTDVNEALGCTVESFTANGITAGSGQLAVSTRGTCARVAKAIYGQQAGAEAVVMVNSSDDYPPYEGEILSNPDTGEAYEVTIPFLGVRSSDGAVFDDASTATVAAAQLENPSFRGYASFTSGGPRSGDGGMGPKVAAPGVSIASAGVGTGTDAEVSSGTSMAAPHVAGVAALAIEAHPTWTASDVSATLISTADPDKVSGQDPRMGGVGVVDAAQVVATQVSASGDAFTVEDGDLHEAALNFGFQESSDTFGGTKTVTVTNHGEAAVTYSAEAAAYGDADGFAAAVPATVSVAPSEVTVAPGETATLEVTVQAPASAVPTSETGLLYQIAGDVVLTAEGSTLRVPYLVVPRSLSEVSATGSGALFERKNKPEGEITFDNAGAIAGAADIYQWGLEDAADVSTAFTDTGVDLRAAGVQTYYADETDALMVFALNTHSRYSNAANNEYDILIDVDKDKKTDYILIAVDSGLVRTGFVDGQVEVFLLDVETDALFATGFGGVAPTDSGTVLLPVWASDLGLTAGDGLFEYQVASYSLTSDATDVMTGRAGYNPWSPALTNGQYGQVAVGDELTLEFAADASSRAKQKPKGVMAVVYDNAAGAAEALLVPTP